MAQIEALLSLQRKATLVGGQEPRWVVRHESIRRPVTILHFDICIQERLGGIKEHGSNQDPPILAWRLVRASAGETEWVPPNTKLTSPHYTFRHRDVFPMARAAIAPVFIPQSIDRIAISSDNERAELLASSLMLGSRSPRARVVTEGT